MKLGLVFPGCHKRGGVERSVLEAARAWAGDHDVTVYARDVDTEALDGVRVHRVTHRRAPRSFEPVVFAHAAREAVRHERHDHVIAFGVGDVGADILWVNSVHRAWLERSGEFAADGLRSASWRRHVLPHHQVLLQLERRHFRSSDPSAVIVVADAVGHDLTRLYGVAQDRVHTVHNGFDPGEFDPGRRRALRAEARRALQLPDDAVVLLMVANELHRKGFPVLLEAVARVGDPRLHVVLAGRAAPTGFTRRIEELGLAARVRHLGVQPDVGRVHAVADVFVLPTKYEAFCLAVVEALASGLPVIVSTTPGAGDLVVDGVNGRLQQDPTDPVELATLIRTSLDDAARTAWAAAAAPSVAHLTWGRLFDEAAGIIAASPTRRGRPG